MSARSSSVRATTTRRLPERAPQHCTRQAFIDLGFAVSAGLLAEIDERLPRAVLRCSFGARTRPHRQWRKPEAEYNARVDLFRQKVRDAIDAELAWLAGKQGEPEWPQFPPNPARPRRRVILAPGNRKQ